MGLLLALDAGLLHNQRTAIFGNVLRAGCLYTLRNILVMKGVVNSDAQLIILSLDYFFKFLRFLF